jgi:hypothetical protein
MNDVGTRLKIDPHVHSEGSYDGPEPVELILEHAADIELDGVVITDHDAIEEFRRAADLAPEYGLIGIPGMEVSTRSGHSLAIGVSQRPPEGRSFEETVRIVRDHDGVAAVPHPFQRSRHGVRKRHIGDCDGIEVYNSMLFTGYRNRRAQTFARKRGYPIRRQRRPPDPVCGPCLYGDHAPGRAIGHAARGYRRHRGHRSPPGWRDSTQRQADTHPPKRQTVRQGDGATDGVLPHLDRAGDQFPARLVADPLTRAASRTARDPPN